jgi:hypothetical protein
MLQARIETHTLDPGFGAKPNPVKLRNDVNGPSGPSQLKD